MDHLADDGVELVVVVEEDAVEEAAVRARVVEGDVEQVNGRVLDVAAPLASVPVDAVQELFIFDGGVVFLVGVDLLPGDTWRLLYSLLTAHARMLHICTINKSCLSVVMCYKYMSKAAELDQKKNKNCYMSESQAASL